MLSDVVIFSILSSASESPIDFHDKTLDVKVKNLKCFYMKNILNYFVMFLKKNILLRLESYIHLLSLATATGLEPRTT